PMDASAPAVMPNHWLVYFAVDDCDAAAERVGELGGEVTMQPTDVPPGRFALVKDPQGAMFGIIARHPAAA
ncbi:MAG TPA: VOC family protein, partial [Ilumatobacteraceae bacterium]